MTRAVPRLSMEEVWYGDGAAATAARAALAPASALFAGAVAVRGLLYDRGLLAARRAPAPVVSVGALAVGGAGKTPFVLWLAARLRAKGLRPCIVTSGYGGTDRGRTPFLLAAGAAGAQAAARFGDEAVLLALRSGAPVAVGRDRHAACELAARELAGQGRAPDLFLLDDGFQHRRLARDLDIVLLTGREARERLLPAGPLRERPPALSRSDAVVVMTRAGAADSRSRSGGRPSQPLRLHAQTRPSMLVSQVTDTRGDDVSVLAGRRVVAVAAIARPERFLADLEGAGARVVARVLRRDHHRYDDGDRREIEAAAASADLVVTTEKDLVKLAHGGDGRLRALRLEVDVEDEGPLLDKVGALVPFDR